MRLRKPIMLLAITLVMAFAFTGCTKPELEPVAGPSEYPLTITDSYDRQVTISSEPTRIISLAPSNTEIIYALGLGDSVVGVTDVCNYPEAALEVAQVGGFFGPNVERIIELDPHIIIADSLTGKETVEQLAQLGFPVIAIRSDNIAHLMENIELLGEVLNAQEQAAVVIAEMEGKLTEIASKVAGITEQDRPLVYYEVWFDGSAPMTIGPNTFINDAIVRAGGRNVAADATTDWPVLSMEVLVDRNPEVMLYTGHGTQDEIKSRSNWQSLQFVEDERIFVVPDDVINRPSPRIVEVVQIIAEHLHPALFDR